MRPRLGERPTVPYTIRLTPDQIERLKRAAKANNGQKPTDFARDAIVTTAEDVLETTDDPWS